jgi:hypothetical protein
LLVVWQQLLGGSKVFVQLARLLRIPPASLALQWQAPRRRAVFVPTHDVQPKLTHDVLCLLGCFCCWCACSSQRDYLLGKLREVEGKLQASKSVRQATDRERRLAAAAAKLKKEVPGACLANIRL